MESEKIDLEIIEEVKTPTSNHKFAKYDIEDLKLIYEFKYNALKEAALGVSKGMSFYLIIAAALVGYVLTQDLNQSIKSAANSIGILTAILALIACSVIGWGIIKGLNSLEKTLELNNPNLFKELEVNQFVKRGKMAVLVTMVCSVGVLLIFSLAMYFMIK